MRIEAKGSFKLPSYSLFTLQDSQNYLISAESSKLSHTVVTVFCCEESFLCSMHFRILHKKFETFDEKCLQPDPVCLDMNLASEMLRFPQSNTKLLNPN